MSNESKMTPCSAAIKAQEEGKELEYQADLVNRHVASLLDVSVEEYLNSPKLETKIKVFKDYADQEQVSPEVDYETLSKELKELTLEASVLKLETEKLEGELKSKKAKLESINQTLLRTLELLELDTIKAHGFTFFKETRVSVTTPKTLEEKTLLFDFLKEKGLFMQLASVNSQSLNALYKSLSTEALESGEIDFDMAGLRTSEYTSLKMRKAK